MALTQKIFEERAKLKHNNFYDYCVSVFKGTKKKINIICPIHGIFSQIAANHLRGDRCPDCTNNKKLDLKAFIKKANLIHHHKYDYSKVKKIINNSNKIEIICSKHGSFKQSPNKHLSGHNCPKCAIINYSTKQAYTLEEFIEKAKIIHNNKYDYHLIKYKNAKTKIKIICPKHKYFWQIPDNHLHGHGCPKCNYNISKSETEWLDSLNITNRFVTLYIGKKKIIVDGFDPITNTIYEFYGDYWHGNPEIYNGEDYNQSNKITFGKLYENTIKREQIIKNAGYNLVCIWENEFKSK